MSVHAIEREYAATRRTLIAFLCVMAALIVADAASEPQTDSVMSALASSPGLALSLAGLLVGLGVTVCLANVWRGDRGQRSQLR